LPLDVCAQVKAEVRVAHGAEVECTLGEPHELRQQIIHRFRPARAQLHLQQLQRQTGLIGLGQVLGLCEPSACKAVGVRVGVHAQAALSGGETCSHCQRAIAACHCVVCEQRCELERRAVPCRLARACSQQLRDLAVHEALAGL
jgi:hypothetical protein